MKNRIRTFKITRFELKTVKFSHFLKNILHILTFLILIFITYYISLRGFGFETKYGSMCPYSRDTDSKAKLSFYLNRQ